MKREIRIDPLILSLRGQKVILDADLAELYGVSTKRLNEQVKRNAERFPLDFMFQMTAREWSGVRSQIGSAGSDVPQKEEDASNWSQNATSSKRHRGAAYRPFAFTEHGAIMAATILNSPQAVQMSVYVVRAFIQMREQIAANAEILKRLAEIDKELLQHDKALQIIWTRLQPLLAPAEVKAKPRIGFEP
jgi:hypothetical protein